MSARIHITSIGDLKHKDFDPNYYLVKDFFPKIGVSAVIGAPGTGKTTFVLQALASCISGEKFLGKDTIECEVVYFYRDGIATAEKRLMEYQRIFNIPDDAFWRCQSPLNLADNDPNLVKDIINSINGSDDMELINELIKDQRIYLDDDVNKRALEIKCLAEVLEYYKEYMNLDIRFYKADDYCYIPDELLDELKKKYPSIMDVETPFGQFFDGDCGIKERVFDFVIEKFPNGTDKIKIELPQKRDKPLVVVFDTVASINPRENESGFFMPNIQAIAEGVNGSVILIHHLGKDPSKGARGHSSIKGAIDHEITLSKPKGNPRGKWIVDKDRNQAEGLSGSYMIIESGETTILEEVDGKKDMSVPESKLFEFIKKHENGIDVKELNATELNLSPKGSLEAERKAKKRAIDNLKYKNIIFEIDGQLFRTTNTSP